ncbi:hypothetical protein F9K33_10395 [bacterium]|nr:MAG: hypothetical protein F9K33_10395 [bacterium]
MDIPILTGSIGVGLLLLAFFLNVFRKISTDSYTYILLNIAGAVISGYASYLIDYWPFVILEGTWALVACAALIKKQN